MLLRASENKFDLSERSKRELKKERTVRSQEYQLAEQESATEWERCVIVRKERERAEIRQTVERQTLTRQHGAYVCEHESKSSEES